jgi:hypothetical protein
MLQVFPPFWGHIFAYFDQLHKRLLLLFVVAFLLGYYNYWIEQQWLLYIYGFYFWWVTAHLCSPLSLPIIYLQVSQSNRGDRSWQFTIERNYKLLNIIEKKFARDLTTLSSPFYCFRRQVKIALQVCKQLSYNISKWFFCVSPLILP